MRTISNKCNKTSSEKIRLVVHSSRHMYKEARIILCPLISMHPSVRLERIDVPPKKKIEATISNVSDQYSSQDEDEFEGFGPKDKINFNQKTVDLEHDVDKVQLSSKAQDVMAKLESNPAYRKWKARSAMKPSGEAYHMLFEENDEEENLDDAKTLDEDNKDDLNTVQTVTTTDSEFQSHNECDEADAGSHVKIEAAEDNMDEYSYEYSEADDHSDISVAQELELNPENSEVDDVILDDEFYGTEYEIDFEDDR